MNSLNEQKWSKAKAAAAKTKNKSSGDLSGDDWKLVMHIYQKMNKNEELPEFAKSEIKESLKKAFKMPKMKLPGAGSMTIKDPMKAGTQATVKMPKPKKPEDSILKSQHDKGVHKLRDFKEQVAKKKI